MYVFTGFSSGKYFIHIVKLKWVTWGLGLV